MEAKAVSIHGITYTDHSKLFKYDYTLDRDATIYVPSVDFGKFKAVGTKDNKLYVVADGHMFTVKEGYSWDGCTHAIDADWNMRASLFHDAMYQVKKCDLPLTMTWWQIDALFRNIMKQDGANLLQRNTYYYAVRSFGALYKLEKFDSLKLGV